MPRFQEVRQTRESMQATFLKMAHDLAEVKKENGQLKKELAQVHDEGDEKQKFFAWMRMREERSEEQKETAQKQVALEVAERVKQLALEEAADHASVTVLRNSSKDNATALCIILIIFSLLLLVLGLVTNKLEMVLSASSNSAMIQQVYRELMLVGVVSVLLFLFEHYKVVDAALGKDFDSGELFQVIHLTLFFCVMVKFLLVCVILGMELNITAKVDALEQGCFLTDVTANYLEEKEKRDQFSMESFVGIFARGKWEHVCLQWQYHIFRQSFIKQHSLPADYPFHVYVRTCVRELSVQLIGLHWSAYFMAGVSAWLNIMLLQSGAPVTEARQEVFWAGIVVTTSLIVLYLAWGVTGVSHKMASHLAPTVRQRESPDFERQERGEVAEIPNDAELYFDDDAPWNNTCCCFNGNEGAPYHYLFPLSSPTFVVRVVQFALLLYSVVLPAYVTYLVYVLASLPPIARVVFNVCTLFCPIIVLFWALPVLVPRLVLTTRVVGSSSTYTLGLSAAQRKLNKWGGRFPPGLAAKIDKLLKGDVEPEPAPQPSFAH